MHSACEEAMQTSLCWHTVFSIAASAEAVRNKVFINTN
jgi:hypothetical protein